MRQKKGKAAYMDKKVALRKPNQIENLEEYACGLLNTCLMLMTASKYHDQADKLGLLNDMEMEKAKAICWHTNSLFAVLKDQFDEVLSRTQLKENDIFESIKGEFDS
jgi:hypothetical protein